jgi:hypothetical protein
MVKKLKLPLEEHREIGRNLWWISTYLLHLTVNLRRSYSPDHPIVRLTSRLADRVNALRELLDEAVFAEYPNKADTDIYYPQDPPPAEDDGSKGHAHEK